LFLALKKQSGLKTSRNTLKIGCVNPLPIGQTWRLLDGPERSPFLVMSLRSAHQITLHF
jgi:hypothetical protein